MLESVREISMKTIIIVAIGIWVLLAAIYFIAVDSEPILPPPPTETKKTIQLAPEGQSAKESQPVEIEVRESNAGSETAVHSTAPAGGNARLPETTTSQRAADRTSTSSGKGSTTTSSLSESAAPVSPSVSRPGSGVAPSAGSFVVQAGAFKADAAARKQAADVEQQGFRTRIQTGPDGLNRVYIGPFSSKEEAERAIQRLKSAGIASFLRPPGN